MQSGFGVEVLTGEAQVVLHCGLEHFGLAVRQAGGLPDHGPSGIHQLLWRAQVVGDVKIPAGPGLVFQQRHGLAVQVHIFPQHGAVGKTFPDEPTVLIVMVMNGPSSCGRLWLTHVQHQRPYLAVPKTKALNAQSASRRTSARFKSVQYPNKNE